ncbi:MAG: flavin reductase [Campylobacterales bacterium]|nr:flavin reductase [Campylobacterales bacterium]
MFQRYTRLSDASLNHPRLCALVCCGGNLMAASWHTPLSREPFRYGIAVRAQNDTHHLLSTIGHCSLNFLDISEYETIDYTGSVHARDECKSEACGLVAPTCDANANPVFASALSAFGCRVRDILEMGDHTLFVCDVAEIFVNENTALMPTLFMGHGRYATLGEERLIVPRG